MTSTPLDIEALMAHAQFVRVIARSLVADEPTAEDVVQQTWLAALEHAPRERQTAAGWLRAVCRNFAFRTRRESARRSNRERTVARPEGTPSTAAIVDRDQTLRAVTAAVVGLREPYKSAVILRFYEGLPPREIARRLGVPSTTVSSRLQRGIEQIKASLDEQHGGARRTWCEALVVLAGIRPGDIAAPAIVATGGVLRLAALLLLAGAVTWKFWPDDGSSRSTPTADPPTASAPVAVDTTAKPAITPNPIRTDPAAGPRQAEHFAVVATGRVVGEHRRPAAGAVVTSFGFDGDPVRTVTDARGEFRVGLARRPVENSQDCGIHVEARGLTAIVAVPVGPRSGKTIDVGTLTLVPAAGVLQVLVRDGGHDAANARVLVRADDYLAPRIEIPSSSDIYLGSHLTNAVGTVALPPLPAGNYVVRAVASHGKAASTIVTLPDAAAAPIVLALGAVHALDAQVVDATDGNPIAGVELDVVEAFADGALPLWNRLDGLTPPKPTDAEGRTRIEGVPDGSPLVLMERAARQLPATSNRQRFPVAAGATWIRVALPNHRSAEWPIDTATGIAPGDGVRCRLEQVLDGALVVGADAVVVGNVLRADDVMQMTGSAIARSEDGLVARVNFPPAVDDARPIRFIRPRTAVIRARDRDGQPVGGVPMGLSEADLGGALVHVVDTNENGEARFDGLLAARFTVHLASRSTLGDLWRAAGIVDVTEGDARSEVTLPSRVDVTVQITIDGASRLPEAFSLITPRATHGPIVEIPDEGELRFSLWPPDGEAFADVIVIGRSVWPEESARVFVGSGARDATLSVTMHAAWPILVEVTPPDDEWFSLAIERFQEPLGRWFADLGTVGRKVGANLYAFELVQERRLRIVDRETGWRSPEFEVTNEPATRRIHVDLRGAGWIRGVVDVPPGAAPGLAVVEVERDGEAVPVLTPVSDDGTFQVRAGRDQRVRLTAKHVALAPDGERATALVSGPVQGVRLRLVRGVTVLGRFATRPGFAGEGITVLAFRDESQEATVALTVRPDVDGAFRFGGLAPGRWRLWFDAPFAAPVSVGPLDVSEPVLDLGELSPPAGATLTVTPDRPGDQPIPAFDVVARSKSVPVYERRATSVAGSPVTVQGLGPGTFEITLRTARNTLIPKSQRAVLECDGRAPLRIVFEMR